MSAQAEAQLSRGVALRGLGRTAEALECFDQALALEPRSARVLNNRGHALTDLRRLTEALSSFEQALQIEAGYAPALYNRGAVLLELQRYEEALECFEGLLACDPQDAEAHAHRGIALLRLQRPAEALASLERALALQPGAFRALNLHGDILRELQRPAEALASYEQALRLAPDDVDSLINRGNALADLERYADALFSYDRAVALAPERVELLHNRASCLLALGRPTRALEDLERALRIEPHHARVLCGAAMTLAQLGRYDEASRYFHELLRVAPDHPYGRGLALLARASICDWRDRADAVRDIRAALARGVAADTPFPFLALTDSCAEQRQCAECFVAGRSALQAEPRWRDPGYRHARIRIAYVSGDLREHAVSHLMAGVFEDHDRQGFEVTGVSLRPAEDSGLGRRVQRAFDRFADVSERGDGAVVELLRGLEIDIAVDLTGYTDGLRPGIFARRAAPVQVNYLGYPGTLGAPYMDYMLADRFLVPSGSEGFYAEKLVLLPECFQANDSRRPRPEQLPSRESCGLPAQGVVYCCFNTTLKLNPQVFGRWMQVLRAVPGSVLWLVTDLEGARRNLRAEAASHGVEPERLVFAPRVSYEEHLARLSRADLFLDTLPFNAGTTASDTLWAGVPVLTCAGEAYAARMAGSLLHTLGLDELITGSLEEYQRRAIQLGIERGTLAGLKARVCARRSAGVLFDTQRFTRHLEAAYRRMWERAERGEGPESFAVEPEKR